MLKKHIAPNDHEQSSEILQIMRAWNRCTLLGPPSLFLFACAERGYEVALKSPVAPLPSKEKNWWCEEINARIKSRCAGLLEVTKDCTDEEASTDYTNITNDIDFSINHHVKFLHRTVWDFFKSEEIWDIVMSRTKRPFNSVARLLGALVLKMKMTDIPTKMKVSKMLEEINDPAAPLYRVKNLNAYLGRMCYVVSDMHEEINDVAMRAARKAASDGTLDSAILDELDKTAQMHWCAIRQWILHNYENKIASYPSYPSKHFPDLNWAPAVFCGASMEKFGTTWNDMLSMAAAYGLTKYVQDKIEKEENPVSKVDVSSLLRSAILSSYMNLKLVSLLLQSGADPNQKFNGGSVWQQLLIAIEVDFLTSPTHSEFISRFIFTTQRKRLVEAMLLLIKAGADPNACYLHKRIDHAPKTTDSDIDKDVLRVRTPLELVTDTNPELAFLKNSDKLRDSLVSLGAVALGYEKIVDCLGDDYRYNARLFKFPQDTEMEISQKLKERLEENEMSKRMAEERERGNIEELAKKDETKKRSNGKRNWLSKWRRKK